jgi:hypothetical protein
LQWEDDIPEEKTYEAKFEEVIEPIIGCKHPIIASGATPIGSAERTPNEQINSQRKWVQKSRAKDEIYSTGCTVRLKKKKFLSLYSNKKFYYSLRAYSHRERWPRTR